MLISASAKVNEIADLFVSFTYAPSYETVYPIGATSSQVKFTSSYAELPAASVAVNLITKLPFVSEDTVVSTAVAVPKVIVPVPDS